MYTPLLKNNKNTTGAYQVLWQYISDPIKATSDALAPLIGNSCSGMVIKKY